MEAGLVHTVGRGGVKVQSQVIGVGGGAGQVCVCVKGDGRSCLRV